MSNDNYSPEAVQRVSDTIDRDVRQRSQLIRNAVKMLSMTRKDVIQVTGYSRQFVSDAMADMCKRGHIRKLDDGRYEYLKSPKNEPLMRSVIASIMEAKIASQWGDMKGESVEDFLARGGMIDTSPTPLKFEHLKESDIATHRNAAGIGHQSPKQTKSFAPY